MVGDDGKLKTSIDHSDKNYLVVPLKQISELCYVLDTKAILKIIGKLPSPPSPNSLCFSKLDCRHLYKVDDTIPYSELHQKPSNKEDDSVLKRVLLQLTGRKNLID